MLPYDVGFRKGALPKLAGPNRLTIAGVHCQTGVSKTTLRLCRVLARGGGGRGAVDALAVLPWRTDGTPQREPRSSSA